MPVLPFKVTPEQAKEIRRFAKKRAPKDDIRPGRVVIAGAPDALTVNKDIIYSALYD